MSLINYAREHDEAREGLTADEKEQRLKWHIGDNLRWLADQPDRPDHVPCGMLTGAFLRDVADRFEALHPGEKEKTMTDPNPNHDKGKDPPDVGTADSGPNSPPPTPPPPPPSPPPPSPRDPEG